MDETLITVAAKMPLEVVLLIDRAAKRQLMSRAVFVRAVLLARLRDENLLPDEMEAE